jgi:hypothetical protein
MGGRQTKLHEVECAFPVRPKSLVQSLVPSSHMSAIGACYYWVRKLQACVYAGDGASGIVAASTRNCGALDLKQFSLNQPRQCSSEELREFFVFTMLGYKG